MTDGKLTKGNIDHKDNWRDYSFLLTDIDEMWPKLSLFTIWSSQVLENSAVSIKYCLVLFYIYTLCMQFPFFSKILINSDLRILSVFLFSAASFQPFTWNNISFEIIKLCNYSKQKILTLDTGQYLSNNKNVYVNKMIDRLTPKRLWSCNESSL